MSTHNIPSCLRISKRYPIMPPDLALGLPLFSSNYPCLEHIFMFPIDHIYIRSYKTVQTNTRRRQTRSLNRVDIIRSGQTGLLFITDNFKLINRN